MIYSGLLFQLSLRGNIRFNICPISIFMNAINAPELHKVIIADAQSIYRNGLRLLLNENPATELVAEAADGKQLMQLVAQWQPQLVLIDLSLPGPNTLELIRCIRSMPKPPACIALSPCNTELMVISLLEAGAKGLIDKTAEKEEIATAIKLVLCGYRYFCKSITESVVSMLMKNPVMPYEIISFPVFNPREKEIIKLICEEKTSQEMADMLNIGVKTVNLERGRILEKMNVKTTAGVAIYAIKNMMFHL